ncbi:hypothetical protein C0995_011017 [Termitomyces sp. Mi166|nr:hypothetical protein C0995_011017 [Termitomyces sp. Mi166\
MFWILITVLELSVFSRPFVNGIHITSDPTDVLNKTYTYVVVGGGTAAKKTDFGSGLAVASRLAEDPSSTILVIEAGLNAQNDSLINNPGQAIPAAALYDWQYNTTVQAVGGNILHMIQLVTKKIGKVLGGSSSINGMCWTRGTIDQYNSIEELGNPGWNFESLLQYMKKAEIYHLPNSQQVSLGATDEPQVHGFDGKVNAGFPQPYEATVAAQKTEMAFQAVISHLAENRDLASGNPNGVARFQYSIKPGNRTEITPDGNLRSSSANAYIYPSLEKKDNLIILTGHQATTIVWSKQSGTLSQATGVRFIPTPAADETPVPEFEVALNREIIVASGAIGVDLPAVGTNLQDQALNLNAFMVPPNRPPEEYTAINAPLSSTVAFLDVEQVLGVGAAHGAGSDLSRSVVQRAKNIVSSGAFTSESGLVKVLQIQAKSIFNFKAPVIEISIQLTQPSSGFGVPLLGANWWNLIPQWRGTVHIKSNNPSVHPEVNPRYYADTKFDLFLKGNATRLARKLFNTSPLKEYVAEELIPGLAVLPDNATDAEVQAYVISTYQPTLHPIGSVPMLPREYGGAVGPDLVVYGTANVRVVGGFAYDCLDIVVKY